MTTLSPDYLKGFNHGYELQKHDPELLEEILKIPQDDNLYYDGLKDGQSEFEKEKKQVVDKEVNKWEKEHLDILYPDSGRAKNNKLDKDLPS
ncbi:MAG: hypothetical protein AAF901_01020 [Bacteroidota bacterium]